MASKYIVHVSEGADPKRGDIVLLDDGREVERLIATLLEGGSEREHIRVYGGDEMNMAVVMQPVVTLVLEGSSNGEAAPAEESRQEAPVEANYDPPQEVATPYVRDGLRFSSLFRRDGEFVLTTAE